MAQTTVVDARFALGAEVLQRLDRRGFPIRDAFWLYYPEDSDWRLWLGTTIAAKDGPSRAYRRVRSALHGIPSGDLDLAHIVVVGLDHPLLQALRTALKTGPGIHAIRFSNNTINGLYIDDAYIYRLQRS